MTNAASQRNALTAHHDVFVGAVLLAFCAVAFGITTTFRRVPAILSQNVPPTFFPRLVLMILAGLSLVLIARGVKHSRMRLRGTEPSTERTEKRPPAVAMTAVINTIAVALVQPLGMLLTVFFITVLLPVSWGERRARRIAVLAVGLPLAIHLVFTVALGMRFPRGALW